MIIIAEKYVPLHSQTHAEPHSLNVGAAIEREHYILKCVADALFLAVLKLPHSKFSSQGHCRGGRSQIPRFSFVVNQTIKKPVRFWVFGGHLCLVK